VRWGSVCLLCLLCIRACAWVVFSPCPCPCPRAQRRAAEVRAASARKAAREEPSGGDSDSEDDYYDLFASRERVKNGRVVLDGGPQDATEQKERRRKAFKLPARTPVQKHTASPISATIRDVFAEYSGGTAGNETASSKSPGRPWVRPQPLEQSYGEALRDIYALTPGGKRPERGRGAGEDAAARRAVSSRLHAAERAAEEEADELRRRRERERSMRESTLGPADFLAVGTGERRFPGGGSPISNAHVTPVSYVQGTLREAMSEYSSRGSERSVPGHRPSTQQLPTSRTSQAPSSVSFSLPSAAGHVDDIDADGGGRDFSTASQGSALLYTTLNGDARRVSRSLDELKQANLSLTTGLRDLQRELEQERQVFESKLSV
jgi:hypothetical protein